MLASPVPIYLGCAGLIVGSLGLGAQYMLGGNSVPVSPTRAESEQPLFARSVEEASLPTSQWSSQHSNVAHYEPMVKLLTTPSRSVPPAPAAAAPQAPAAPQANVPQQSPPAQAAPPSSTAGVQPAPEAAPREVVRDIPQQTKPSKRTRNARAQQDESTSTDQVDPRDAYAKADRDPRPQERQRNTKQVDTRQVDDERRDGSRRSERRYGNRNDSEPVDARSRSERRRVDVEEPRQRGGERFRSDRQRVEVEDDRPRAGERRVIVREESEPRIVRGPEQRGFSPFNLFGIFDR
jgi:hypothetical protein